jgi:hypothetical protein
MQYNINLTAMHSVALNTHIRTIVEDRVMISDYVNEDTNGSQYINTSIQFISQHSFIIFPQKEI